MKFLSIPKSKRVQIIEDYVNGLAPNYVATKHRITTMQLGEILAKDYWSPSGQYVKWIVLPSKMNEI